MRLESLTISLDKSSHVTQLLWMQTILANSEPQKRLFSPRWEGPHCVEVLGFGKGYLE